MTIIETEAYRSAFLAYVRRGTPIRLSFKDAGRTGQYVWRTAGDGKVRLSHRQNDGRLFDWADAPETGHPGAGFNCRCEAVTYVPGETEYAEHTFTTDFKSSANRWNWLTLSIHYHIGGGRDLSLQEIGHLQEVAEHHAYSAGDEGAFRRLSGQIARAAREQGYGTFDYPFDGAYSFSSVDFAHGNSRVFGKFTGSVSGQGEMLRVMGETNFNFEDDFINPIGLEVEQVEHLLGLLETGRRALSQRYISNRN